MLRFSLGDEDRGRRLARWMCSLRKYPITRFGFDTISILELKGSGFVRTDIGKQIDKSIKAAIAKQSHDPESSGGDATPHFRIGADRKVRVGTVSTTDPKQLNEKGGYYALFHGTFDLRSKKWLMAEARPLTRNERPHRDPFGDLELDETTFATEEDKAKGFDDRMNEVYLTVTFGFAASAFCGSQERADRVAEKARRHHFH